MSRETTVTIYVLLIIFFLSMAWVHKSHGAEFPTYQYVELSDLADNPDKYNSEEIQIRGTIKNINEYTGKYGGTYIGLTIQNNITIFAYASEIHFSLAIGDSVLINGNFHKYALYGGQGHDMFVATHHIERLE